MFEEKQSVSKVQSEISIRTMQFKGDSKITEEWITRQRGAVTPMGCFLIAISLIGAVILGILLFPVIASSSRAGAANIYCRNHLKQLSLYLAMYATDNRDYFPNQPNEQCWEMLKKANLQLDGFGCKNSSYYYDPPLVSLKEMDAPEKIIIAGCPYHGFKVFADGHVAGN